MGSNPILSAIFKQKAHITDVGFLFMMIDTLTYNMFNCLFERAAAETV